jgi:regulatory protein
MTAEQTQDPVPGPAMDRLAAARAALAAAEQSVAAGGAAPVRGPTQAEASMDAGGATSPDSPRATGGGESDPYQVARTIALRQLTVGPRTRAQLRTSCAVLDRLSEVGLVDDAAFARLVVHSRQETKGLAALALRHELRGKGVAEEHIDTALEDTDPDTEREQARRLVAKRLRTMHGLEREVQTRRLAGFLARKGYGPGVSYEVIRDALEAAPEHQRD